MTKEQLNEYKKEKNRIDQCITFLLEQDREAYHHPNPEIEATIKRMLVSDERHKEVFKQMLEHFEEEVIINTLGQPA